MTTPPNTPHTNPTQPNTTNTNTTHITTNADWVTCGHDQTIVPINGRQATTTCPTCGRVVA